MVRIVEESVSDKWEVVADMLAQHVDELTTHKHLMVLKPDRERYAMLEQAGALLALFAYDGDELVGYSVNFLSTNLHYSDLFYSHNDVLFVRKSHRNGRTGLRLIQATERAAKERGARFIIWHAKPKTALDALLPRVGYGVQDVLYSREI